MRVNVLKRSACSYFLWGVLAFITGSANAQSVNTYQFATNVTSSLGSDLSSNVIDMSTGTTQLVAANLDDNSSGVTNIGFSFSFAGSAYTQFSANSNGIIRLGGTAISTTAYSTNASTSTAPHLAAMGGDLRTGNSGKVHYKLIGTAPTRTLVIEFLNMSLDYVGSPGSNDGTFQVRLYETSNVVEFVYGAMFRNSSTTDSPTQTFNISLAAGTSSPNRICVDTNNTLITTGSLTVLVYAASTNMAKVHSTANGSRRAYIFTPPACSGTPAAGTLSLSGTPACGFTGVNIAVAGGASGSGISYQWQSSADSINWSNLLVSDTLSAYSGPSVFSNTFFRRVTLCGPSALSSNSPGIFVRPLYLGTTQSTAAVCGDSITLTLQNTSANAAYQWEVSADSLNWFYIGNTSAGTFKTPTPTSLSFYRAVVSCSMNGTSGNTVPVKVIPVVGGTATITSNLCNDSALLSVSGSSTGSGLSYQWESSTDSLNWSTIPGATSATVKLPQPATFMFYRRVTTCGSSPVNSVAVKVSNNCSGFGYGITYNTGITYNSIQSTGSTFTWLSATDGDDDRTTPVYFPAGFNFTYNGAIRRAFYVNTNGWLSLDTTAMVQNGTAAYTNNLNNTSPALIIAPFWEDLVALGSVAANKSYIKYQVTGSSPNRVMTVEWAEMERWNYGSPNLNFQVKFYEGTNNIEYVYGKMQAFDGSNTGAFDYSVGMTGVTPANGQRISLLADNTANFSVSTVFNGLTRVPLCYSSYLFTAGAAFNPTNSSVVPSNDSSSTPVVLTVNPVPCTEGCGTYYTSKGATPSGLGVTPPTSTPDDDVWFRFTAPASGQVSINIFGSPDYNPAFQVMGMAFDSTGMGSAWFRNANSNALEQVTVTTLTPFADYLIRVYHAGTGFGSTSGAFSICVNEVIPVPFNDTIGGAITLTPGLTCVTTAGTTLGATASPQAVCAGLADDDVWYKFVANNSVDTIRVTGSGTFRAHVQVLTNQLASLYCQNTGTNGGEVAITASNLLKDSTYFIRIYHTNAGTASANFTVCVTGANATVPNVLTGTHSNVTLSNATIGGSVLSNGGFPVTRSGMLISTSPNPTLSAPGTDSTTNPVVTTGAFSKNVSGLYPSTFYYYRAYAVNAVGEGYGADSTFITPAAAIVPNITKTAATNVTTTSARVGGNIISDGGAMVTASGIVYATTPNPALSGMGVVDSTTNPVVSMGSFTINPAGLTHSTKYYYRAYATNSAGTAYSIQDSFTTAPIVNTFPYLQNFDSASVAGWSSMITAGTANDWVIGTPTKTILSGAYSAPNVYVTKLSGDYSSYHDAAVVSPQFDFTGLNVNPVLRFKHKFETEEECCDGGWVETSINGGTWTRLIDTLGTGTNFNTVTARSWYNYAIGAGNSWNENSNLFSSNTNGWITSIAPITGAAGQANVRIRFVFHSDVNTEYDGWALDDIEVFNPTAPLMLTGTVSNLTPTSITLGGIVLNDGGNGITASGIVISTSAAPVRGGMGVIDSTTRPLAASGTFSVNVAGLVSGTTYYYRAYAMNAVGTSYGADSIFVMPASAVAPSVTTTAAVNVTGYRSIVGGNVTSDGGATVTASGVVYSTLRNPVLSGPGVIDSTTTPLVASGNYSFNLNGLLPATKYYFRSYAINSAGTGYGLQDSFTTSLVITSLPYNQGFEGGSAGWNVQSIGGAPNNWVLGTPAKTFLTGAHGGTQAWVTKLTGVYDDDVNSAVVSPQFNLAGLTQDPVLRFYHKFVTEAGYDAMIVEVSTDGGNTWAKADDNLGTGGNFNTVSAYAWYNSTSVDGPINTANKFSSINSGNGTNQIYSSHVNGWIQSAVKLSGTAGQNNVKVRFNFGSDVSSGYDGWAIDDIEVVTIDSPTVTASNINIVPSATSVSVTLTKGNGSRRLIVGRLASTTAVAPSNWTLYTPNSAFGSGSTTGTGNYVVYSDTGSAVTVTGLTQLTGYTFDVYEYDGKYMHVRFGLPVNNNITTTPVKLTSFRAVNQQGDAMISWITASERNNAGFDLERSTDGKTFERVTFVKGAGNSNSTLRYAYKDARVFELSGSAKVYYRLKQLDLDGKYEYSDVVVLANEITAQFNVSAYPVPFSKEVTLTIASPQEGDATITVMDLQGRMIAERKANVQEGSAVLVLGELNTVHAGVYFVKVTQHNESRLTRIVKVN